MFVLALLSISMDQILRKSLYVGMLLLLLSASMGVPLPEDIPLLLAGAMTRLGYGEVVYVIIVGLVGVLTGDLILYTVGRRFGMGVLNLKPFRAVLTTTHIAQMKLQFRKRGSKIIFFGRFFAGIRSIMCLTAGMCKVPLWKFILIDFSGALCTVPLLVGLGWWFSHSISKVVRGVATAEKILAAFVVVMVIAWVIYIHLSKRSKIAQIEKSAKEDFKRCDPKPEIEEESN